jgi:S-adenosylmethionine hydrolase
VPRRGRASRLVTLTSDIGAAYAAQMKAVLAHTLPPGSVVDLTHELRPHAIAEAAFVVRAAAERFPAGTVHVVVVDPGVGGARAPLIVACRDGSLLVGPDNGVLMPLADRLGVKGAYRIDPGRLARRARVGTTFDGRDVFAPAAAALAAGSAPRTLGTPIRPAPLVLPEPNVLERGARGVVLHVDRFGNAITNIPTDRVPDRARELRVVLGRRTVQLPWTDRYEAVPPGALLALGSSFGTVELARNGGSAAERLALAPGSPVRVGWRRPRHRTGK